MQKCCAQYMNSFIGKIAFFSSINRLNSSILERLQKRLNTLKLPHDDDLQLPITGLKQVRFQ